VYPITEKCAIVVSLSRENGMNMAKLAKDFDIPTNTLATILKKKDNMTYF